MKRNFRLLTKAILLISIFFLSALAQASGIQHKKQLVLVDPQIREYSTPINGLSEKAEITVMGTKRDFGGIPNRITKWRDLEAVHIFSHGAAGTILLGNETLSNDTIGRYSKFLAGLGKSLAPGADILIYGCNVGKGRPGRPSFRH